MPQETSSSPHVEWAHPQRIVINEATVLAPEVAEPAGNRPTLGAPMPVRLD